MAASWASQLSANGRATVSGIARVPVAPPCGEPEPPDWRVCSGFGNRVERVFRSGAALVDPFAVVAGHHPVLEFALRGGVSVEVPLFVAPVGGAVVVQVGPFEQGDDFAFGVEGAIEFVAGVDDLAGGAS